MAKSLQEQLLSAGLVDEKKARKVKSDQRKQVRKVRKGSAKPSAEDIAVRQAQERAKLEKIERDKQLNRERDEKAARKALNAEIRQLIREHQQPQDSDGLPYSFQDDGKIRRIYVAETMKSEIVKGSLGVVRHGRVYAVVPAEIAQRVSERDPSRLVVLFQKNDGLNSKDEDDPYAGYEVPDDLIW